MQCLTKCVLVRLLHHYFVKNSWAFELEKHRIWWIVCVYLDSITRRGSKPKHTKLSPRPSLHENTRSCMSRVQNKPGTWWWDALMTLWWQQVRVGVGWGRQLCIRCGSWIYDGIQTKAEHRRGRKKGCVCMCMWRRTEQQGCGQVRLCVYVSKRVCECKGRRRKNRKTKKRESWHTWSQTLTSHCSYKKKFSQMDYWNTKYISISHNIKPVFQFSASVCHKMWSNDHLLFLPTVQCYIFYSLVSGNHIETVSKHVRWPWP